MPKIILEFYILDIISILIAISALVVSILIAKGTIGIHKQAQQQVKNLTKLHDEFKLNNQNFRNFLQVSNKPCNYPK